MPPGLDDFDINNLGDPSSFEDAPENEYESEEEENEREEEEEGDGDDDAPEDESIEDQAEGLEDAPADGKGDAPGSATSQIVGEASIQSHDTEGSNRLPRVGRMSKMEELRALPAVRELEYREGKAFTAEELARRQGRTQTMASLLLYTRGISRNPPCSRCATGRGRLLRCVALEGFFRGACATCEMTTRGNRCDWRHVYEGKVYAPKPRNRKSKSAMRELRSPSSDGAEQGKNDSVEGLTGEEIGGVSLKRKHSALDHIREGPAPTYVSPYQAPSWMGTTDTSANPPRQSTAFTEARPPLLDYVYQRQHPANGNKRHQILARTQQGSQELSYHSASTLVAAPGPRQPFQQAHPRDSGVGEGQKSGALIDNLSRKQQKQIFSIIGGIQSGIRSVRQQTDDLQKQLDLLQEALGIGEDE